MYYPCSENKDADQLRGYREADLRLCFRICKNRFSPDEAHVTNKEVGNKIQDAIGKRDDLLSIVKKRKFRQSHLKSVWHGQENFARDSKGNKKESKTA